MDVKTLWLPAGFNECNTIVTIALATIYLLTWAALPVTFANTFLCPTNAKP